MWQKKRSIGPIDKKMNCTKSNSSLSFGLNLRVFKLLIFISLVSNRLVNTLQEKLSITANILVVQHEVDKTLSAAKGEHCLYPPHFVQ